jgi:hypothetical protein
MSQNFRSINGFDNFFPAKLVPGIFLCRQVGFGGNVIGIKGKAQSFTCSQL